MEEKKEKRVRRKGGIFRREEMRSESEEEEEDSEWSNGSEFGDNNLLNSLHLAVVDARRPSPTNHAYSTTLDASLSIPHGDTLPKSLSALAQAHRASLYTTWDRLWRLPTTRGGSLRRIDPRPPGPAFSKPFSSLPRPHAVALTRLRTNFCDLGARRFWLGENHPGRLCEECGVLETRAHYLMECTRYKEERKELRKAVGRRRWSEETVFNPHLIVPLLRFVLASGRFHDLYTPLLYTPRAT